MTVAELLARCSASELTDWIAYERIAGPLGADRLDIHAGIVASTTANVMRQKNSKTYKPKDFIPKWDRPGIRDPEGMRAMMISLTLQMGGRVVEADR